MKNILIVLMSAALLAVVAGCGEKEKAEPELGLAEGKLTAGELLPPSRPDMLLQQMQIADSEVKVEEYAGELADAMYRYGLIGLASALYESDTIQYSIEIDQFDSSLHAYGYYSLTRPPDADLIELGTEGYINGTSLYFTQGPYFVTIAASDSTESVRDRLEQLAVSIATQAEPVDENAPRQFLLFPANHRVPTTNKYYVSKYMRIDLLNDVFTSDYAFGSDTATCFLTMDRDGEKFIKVSEFAHEFGDSLGEPKDIPFDEDHGLVYTDPVYGRVVAGLKAGRLIGMAGYKPAAMRELMKNWVSGLE